MSTKTKGNILITDDDEDLRTSLKRLLTVEGFSVDEAASGSEALKKILEKEYDVALIDIVLPDMKGTKILSKFKKKPFGRTRKIIMTGFATAENAIESINLAADAFVTKPINSFALLKIIELQLKKRDDEIKSVQEQVNTYISQYLEERLQEIEVQLHKK